MQDVVDEDKVSVFRKILKDWVSLERMNILRKGLSLKWIRGPVDYETNHTPISPEVTFQETAYWNANDIPLGLLNFTQATTSLRNMMNRVAIPEETRKQWELKVIALDNVIRAFWDDLQDISREALQEELGRNLVADN